jgi:sugar phosphate permease
MQKRTSVASLIAQTSYYKWIIVVLLWIVSFFNYADRSAITAIFPILKANYHFTDAELGLLGSSFLWVYACSAPFVGFLGDRFKRKTIIVSGLIVWSLITFMTPFAGTVAAFILLRGSTGLGEASYYPSGTSMISDYHGQKTRSRALSIHQTAVFVGGIIGTTFAGYLADQLHWQYAFFIYGGAGIILALILFFLMKEAPKGISDHVADKKEVKEEKVPVGVALKTPSVLLLSFVFFGANFVTWALNTWVPDYMHTQYHLTLTGAAFAGTSSLQIASLLGVLFGGFLADFLYKRSQLARFYILAAGLLVATPFVFLIGQTLSVTVLVFCLIGAGFFKGMFDANIYAAMHQVTLPNVRSTAVGFMTFVGFVGAGIAPLVIGVYSPALGLGPAMALTSVLYIIAGVPLLIFRATISKDSRKLFAQTNASVEDVTPAAVD